MSESSGPFNREKQVTLRKSILGPVTGIEVRCFSSRYTYGKGAKGRANVQLYFNWYGWNKKPTLAKDIPVSTK